MNIDFEQYFQEDIPYPFIPIIIFAVLVLAGLIYYLIQKYKEKHGQIEEESMGGDGWERPSVLSLREKYLSRIDGLVSELSDGKIDSKKAYQDLSLILRGFLHESTGKAVLSYTLLDIKKMKLPEVENLLKDWYVPEFEEEADGEIENSIGLTATLIKESDSWLEAWINNYCENK